MCTRASKSARRPPPLALEASEQWEEVRARLVTDSALEAYEFSFESPHIVGTDEVYDYARTSFTPSRPILAAAMDPHESDLP